VSIWVGHMLPGSFDGYPIHVTSTQSTYEFNVASHGAVGRSGETLEPLGAKSRPFTVPCIFMGQNFEGHKRFTQLLDLAIIPMKPGILAHPFRGTQEVYPLRYDEQIDAAELTAIITVTFKRHALRPEITPEFGIGIPQLFDLAVMAPSLASYIAALAFITVWNSAILAAITTLIRLAGDLPSMIDRSVYSLADSFQGWVEAKLENPFEIDSPTEDLVRARYDAIDQVSADLRKEARVREAIFQGILDGTTAYDPGIYAGGSPPPPGQSSPPAAQHAVLVTCALWETAAAAFTANQLIDHIQQASREGKLDGAAADAAAVFLRRRIRRATALQAAVNPYYAGPIVTQLSRVADSLVRVLAGVRSPRLQVRRVTIDRTNRPLVLWALDWLGDASRAAEIRKLNPDVRGDFNRLLLGTELKVPAA